MRNKNILISMQAHMGDFIWATSAFAILKKTYPEIKITVLAPATIKELIINNPVIDHVIYSPFSDNDTISKIKKLFWALKVIPKIFKKKFDALLNFDSSRIAVLIAKITGISHIVGGNLFFAGYNIKNPLLNYYTDIIDFRENQDYIHEVINYQTIIKSYFGIFNNALSVLPNSSKYEQNASNLIEDDSKLIVALCIRGGKNSANMWSIENFRKVIDFLNSKFESISFYIVGSKRDFSYAQKLITKPSIYNICGKTSLLELKEFLQKTNLLISSDTGTIHMAAAINTNIISIHGYTYPAVTGPMSHKAISFHSYPECSPCAYKTQIEKMPCPTYPSPKCFELITHEEVEEAVVKILEKVLYK